MDIILSNDAYDLYWIEDKIPGRVYFELESTNELDLIADTLRQKLGYVPFFDDSKTDIWDSGWYDFILQVDVFKGVITGIECIVQGNVAYADKEICPDDKHNYWLDDYITFDKEDIMKQLVAELRKRHTSLNEIEKEVREYYG